MAPAIVHAATLDGQHLDEADTSSWDIQNPELKRIRQAQNGARREARAYRGPGTPLQTTSLVVTLDWESVGSMKRLVEELISAPGPHDLVLWRHELRTCVGDGDRREWTLPWRQAVDVVATMPKGDLESKFYPEVRVGLDGTVLTYVAKSPTDYAGGDPASGEVWFLEGGYTFKLADAPEAGALIYAWVVPVFQVFDSGENPKKLSDPIREPRRLVLMER